MKNKKQQLCAVILGCLGMTGCSSNSPDMSPKDDKQAPIARGEVRKRDFGQLMGSDFLLFGGPPKAGSGRDSLSASVNPFLWRSALDTLSFVPLASADSVGGVIVTEWYTAERTPNERLKMSIIITDRVLRADALKVNIHKQRLSGSSWISQPSDVKAEEEMEDIILSKARQLRVKSLEEGN